MPTHAVLRASAAKCQLIPSIDTRLTSQSTLYQHLDQHLDQHLHQNLINIQWTLNWHLHWQSVEDRLIFAHMPLSVNRYIWVGQHSTNYWPTVNKVLIEYRSRFWSSVGLLSTEYQSRCWSRFDQVLIKGRLKYRSGVWIDTQPWMPLLHMIPHANGTIFHIYLKNVSYKSYAVFTDTVSKNV